MRAKRSIIKTFAVAIFAMAFGFCGLIASGAVVEEGNTFTVGAGASFDIGFDEALTNRGVIVIEEGATLGVIGRLVNEGRVENRGRLVQKTLVRNLETRNPYGEIRYDVTRAVTGTIVGADANGWQVKADDNDSWHDAVDADGNPVSEPGDCIVCSYASSGVFENATNFNRDRRYVCSYSDISDAVLSFGRKGHYGRLIVLLRQVRSGSPLSGGRCELGASASPVTIDLSGFDWLKLGSYSAKFSNHAPAKLLNGDVRGLDLTYGAKLFLCNVSCGEINVNGKSEGVSVYVYDSQPVFSMFGDWSNNSRVCIYSGQFDDKSSVNNFTTVYGGQYAFPLSNARLADGFGLMISSEGDFPYQVLPLPFDSAADVCVDGKTTYFANADTAISFAEGMATVTLRESASRDKAIHVGGRLTIVPDGNGVTYSGEVSSASDEYYIVRTEKDGVLDFRMQVKDSYATATVDGLFFDSVAEAVSYLVGNRDEKRTITLLRDDVDCKLAGIAETHYVLDLNGRSFAYGGTCSGHFATVCDSAGRGRFVGSEKCATALAVKGGVFTALDPTPYLADGFCSLVAADGYFHVLKGVPEHAAKVEQNGRAVYYADADMAISRAALGSTVTLYASASATRQFGANGETLTILLGEGGSFDQSLISVADGVENCSIVVSEIDGGLTFTCVIAESEYEARVGNDYYKTAAKAMYAQAGKSGNTITLLKDVVSCAGAQHKTKAASYTLDLNGHSLGLGDDWVDWYEKRTTEYVPTKHYVYTTNNYEVQSIAIVDGSAAKSGCYLSANDKDVISIVSVSGGTFTQFDPSPYVQDGCSVAFDAAESCWRVLSGESQDVPPDERNQVFDTLAAAVAVAPVDGTPTLVRLSDDCMFGDFGQGAGISIGKGQNIVLDLAGHSVFGTGSGEGASCLFLVEGSLRIEDSSSDGAGLVSFASITPAADGGYSTALMFVNGGRVEIAGGKIVNTTVGNHDGLFNVSSGEVVVHAGKFTENVSSYLAPRTRYDVNFDGSSEAIPCPLAMIETMDTVVLSDVNAQVADHTYEGEISYPLTNDLSCVFSVVENQKANSRYANWNADFTITFDRDIPAKSVVLSARCPNFALAGNGWFSVHTGRSVLPAGTPRRLIQTATTMDMTFSMVCDTIKRVYTGICNLLPANAGAKAFVELRIYEKDAVDGTETGNYITVSSCEYTLPDPRPAHIGEVTYSSVEEAVAAVDVSVRPDDYGTRVSVGRVPDVADEITLQPGMTIDFGPIAAEDVLKDLTFRSPDALHSVVPVMDATGLVQVGVRLDLSELAIPTLDSSPDAETGDEIPAIDVGTEESDGVLINAVGTKKGLFYAVQCCDSLIGDKSGDTTWTIDGLWHEGNGKAMQLNATKGVSGSRFYRISATDDPRVLRYKGEQR